MPRGKKSGERQVIVTTSISESTEAFFRKEAEKEHRSKSAILRRALERFVENAKRRKAA